MPGIAAVPAHRQPGLGHSALVLVNVECRSTMEDSTDGFDITKPLSRGRVCT
jgi:hypothetical protein